MRIGQLKHKTARVRCMLDGSIKNMPVTLAWDGEGWFPGWCQGCDSSDARQACGECRRAVTEAIRLDPDVSEILLEKARL